MFKHVLLVALIATFHSGYSQQADSWSTYMENDQLKISVKHTDCHYPEKGVNNRYLLFKIENLKNSDITFEYTLKRSYNGKEVTSDIESFLFEIPANSKLESDCDKLTAGLHLFSKMLSVGSKSVLSGFNITEMRVNGKTVE